MQCLFAHSIFKGIVYPKINSVSICSHSFQIHSVLLYGKEHFSFRVPQKKDNYTGLEWQNFHCWVNLFNWCPQVGRWKRIDFFSILNLKNKSKGYCTLIHSSRNRFEIHTRKIDHMPRVDFIEQFESAATLYYIYLKLNYGIMNQFWMHYRFLIASTCSAITP